MTPNDDLEKFVRSNRDAFDDKEPPKKVWDNVRKTLFPQTRKLWWDSVVIWRAAAMIFMALSIYLLIPKETRPDSSRVAQVTDFSDVEAFYIQEISEKVELIDQLSDEGTSNDFTENFQQLEAMYSVLKEEYKTRPSKKVKDALVLNLLVRIDLLNKQLQRLEDEESEESSELKGKVSA